MTPSASNIHWFSMGKPMELWSHILETPVLSHFGLHIPLYNCIRVYLYTDHIHDCWVTHPIIPNIVYAHDIITIVIIIIIVIVIVIVIIYYYYCYCYYLLLYIYIYIYMYPLYIYIHTHIYTHCIIHPIHSQSRNFKAQHVWKPLAFASLSICSR